MHLGPWVELVSLRKEVRAGQADLNMGNINWKKILTCENEPKERQRAEMLCRRGRS